MERKNNETGIKSERIFHCLLSLPNSLSFTSPFRPKLLISLRKQWWERTLPSAPDSSRFPYQRCWHLNLTFPTRTAGRAISFVGMMIEWGYAVQVSGKDYTDRSNKKTDSCSATWWHVRPVWCHPHHIAKMSYSLPLFTHSNSQNNPYKPYILWSTGDAGWRWQPPPPLKTPRWLKGRWMKTVTISHSGEVARNTEKEGVNWEKEGVNCSYNLNGDFVVGVYLR